MDLDNNPTLLLGEAQDSLAFSVVRSYTGFGHCHLCPASVSDETCFFDSTGDLGQQNKVPNEARGQVTDSEC